MAGRESRYATIATVLAVIAALLTFFYLNSIRVSEAKKTEAILATYKNEESVLIAKRNIAVGSVIRKDDIVAKKILAAYIVPNAATDSEDVVGQTALVDIYEGEQIAKGRFGAEKNVQIASRTIGGGKVAIAVGVDEISGVSGGIRPGDRVNVYVTFEESENTDLLFKNLLVRGVGGTYPYGGKPPSETLETKAGFGSTEPSSGSQQPSAVILEVNEDEAAKLTYASEKGSVRLALLPVGGK